MIEYLVIVMLTFADGSYVQYNDGKWATATGMEACNVEITKAVKELKETYKNSDPKPSTFISGCVQKESTPKEK